MENKKNLKVNCYLHSLNFPHVTLFWRNALRNVKILEYSTGYAGQQRKHFFHTLWFCDSLLFFVSIIKTYIIVIAPKAIYTSHCREQILVISVVLIEYTEKVCKY